ncbi:N-acetylglucosamine-6-phosphate deacetylase [bacterium]|nr:N-acetylglucosamine-6-phosphate deacetylase [bacterium]
MTIIAQAPGPQGWDAYEVTLENGQPKFAPTNREPDSYCIPGFVDLHIHGAFGIDFMSATSDDLIQLAELLRAEGYAGFLPTTITYDASTIQTAINNLPNHSLIWGFHLEGPFISPEYPGAQPPEAIIPIPGEPSPWNEILNDPRLRLITLAPEQPNALPLIKKLKEQGVIVSAGHTNATYAEIQSAVQAGLTHATHTYNAMRPLHHREPGTLGAVLNLDQIHAELIYDRHHVSKPAAEILLKIKPADKVIAVSDCTLAKGKAPGDQFTMWGHLVTKGKSDVRLTSINSLAGSCASLLDCFRNLAQDFSPEIATRLCSINPLKELKKSKFDRWIILDQNFQIQPL